VFVKNYGVSRGLKCSLFSFALASLLLGCAAKPEKDAAPLAKKSAPNVFIAKDSAVTAYMLTPEMKNAALQLGLFFDTKVLNKQLTCKPEYQIRPVAITIKDPVEFAAPNRPTKGAWIYKFQFARCGDIDTFNALFEAEGEVVPRITPLPPGDTLTALSPRLARDVIPSIYVAAGLKGTPKSCQVIVVTNTILQKPPKSQESNWQEEWTIRACDNSFKINYCFTPSKTGGIDWVQNSCK